MAFADLASGLLRHIPHIVALGSKEQMFGVDAKRYIAAVEHFQVFPNLTVVQFIRDAMS